MTSKTEAKQSLDEPSVFFKYPILQIVLGPTCIILLAHLLSPPAILDSTGFSLRFPSATAFAIVAWYFLFELLLLRFVPGQTIAGPKSSAGDTPLYTVNGVACYLLSIACFVLGSTELSFGLQLYRLGIVYENYVDVMVLLSLSVPFVVLLLFIKGIYSPSGKDNRRKRGDNLFDYFWGIELYPTVFGISLKQLVNCRFGVMGWPLIAFSCAFAQRDLYGSVSSSMLVSVALIMCYGLKFFIWEAGYFRTIDIIHDRFGFYLCFGCMCVVPGFYTSPFLWFVRNPIALATWQAALFFSLGLLSILVTFLADRQREDFRSSRGQQLIWGKKPMFITAPYRAATGQMETNLLLASGYWGISRHFHYIPELSATFFWSVPALVSSIVPYFYFVYLVVLLFDRQLRDEKKCSEKYGPSWKEYCILVPWKIIPYVY